jgi:4-hydroxy-3-polyprenylbenzoate decarboxylase
MPAIHNDVREFIAFLEQKGELVRVKREVDPILEVNQILDKLARTGGPAVLFENVKGSDIPVFGNAFGTSQRVSWAFGKENLIVELEDQIDTMMKLADGDIQEQMMGLKAKGIGAKWKSLMQLLKSPEFRKGLKEGKKGMAILPVRVKKGKVPCKEIVLTGDEIDLDKFPLIKLWPQDGDKYFTLPLVITRDPETKVHNVGTYRMMQLDKKSLCMHWLPQKHGFMHHAKAEKLGQDLPVAVVIGADPAFTLGGSLALIGGLHEFMVAGMLRGKAMEYTLAEDSDLYIPASAEIVFEGVVKNGERAVEGPFGEFHGYYSPTKDTGVFHIQKITMRKNPIFHVSTTGMPITEIHVMGHEIARIAGTGFKSALPSLVDLNMGLLIAGFPYTVIMSIDKARPYHAQEMMHLMWASSPQSAYITNIIVVDGDVDVNNLDQVVHAMSMHFRPDQDLMITPRGMADLEKPSTYPRGVGARMGIDATTKLTAEGLERPMPDPVVMDEAITRKVEQKWREYGF